MSKIELNKIELHYQEYGDGEDVVILLHGFLSSSKMWTNYYVPDLTKRYKVYAIDVRGHGNSNKVKSGCNLQQMADDIYQFVILKNIDECVLPGMSMGGAIAIQFATNFPDKLKSYSNESWTRNLIFKRFLLYFTYSVICCSKKIPFKTIFKKCFNKNIA